MIIIFTFLTLVKSSQLIHTFAVSWPGTVCRVEDCLNIYMDSYDWETWNIHGLWPSKYMSSDCD